MANITTPWTVFSPYKNDTHALNHLLAPAWVDSANIRSTLDILQSCILTLIACIYTALHLDTPTETAWHRLLLTKLKWVALTLFVPEVSIFMAVDQLHQAWTLRESLRKTQADADPGMQRVEINLTYAFYIVMGGVRVQVDDMFSLPDLNWEPSDDWPSLFRLNGKAVSWLATRGHWIHISQEKIMDKSKANSIQKSLVLIQVLWMVVQCIARRAYDLPLTLLEVHILVHVVCAVILYMFWFKKPLDIQDPEIINPDAFKGEIAILMQHQFYDKLSKDMAVFPRQKSPNDPLPDTTPTGGSLSRWIAPTQERMTAGSILPSGLACANPNPYRFRITSQFLRRWDAILNTFPQDRGQTVHQFLKTHLPDFTRGDDDYDDSFRNLPFAEGKRNLDVNSTDFRLKGLALGPIIAINQFGWYSLFLAALPALYGGIHLAAQNWDFHSEQERLLWKAGCIYIIATMPTLTCLVYSFALRDSWETAFVYIWVLVLVFANLAYIMARIYIVVQSFLSLRHVPIGVYLTPAWLQMFPHF